MDIPAIPPQGITGLPTLLPVATQAATPLTALSQVGFEAVSALVPVDRVDLSTPTPLVTTAALPGQTAATESTIPAAVGLNPLPTATTVVNPTFIVTGGLDAVIAGTLLGGLGLGRGMTAPEPADTHATGPLFPTSPIPDVAPPTTTAHPFDPYSDSAEADLAQITYSREMIMLSAQRAAAHVLNLLG